MAIHCRPKRFYTGLKRDLFFYHNHKKWDVTSQFFLLTQKKSLLNPGIRLCEAPTCSTNEKKASGLSKELIALCKVFMTIDACSASSKLSCCSSFVLRDENFSKRSRMSACSSNNLHMKKKAKSVQIMN